MQWLHASYGFGVTLGPIIMTTGLNLFNSWRLGYQVVGAAQLLLAASFLLTIRMWQNGGVPHAPEQERHLMDYHTPFGETLRQPLVWLNLLMFFLYTGAEFSFGSWTYSSADSFPRCAGGSGRVYGLAVTGQPSRLGGSWRACSRAALEWRTC